MALAILQIAATRSTLPYRDGFPVWRGPGNPYPVVGWRVRNPDGSFGPWSRARSPLYVGPLLLASPLGFVNFVEGFTGTEPGSLQKAPLATLPPINAGLFVAGPEDAPLTVALPNPGSEPTTTNANAAGASSASSPISSSSVRVGAVDRDLVDGGPVLTSAPSTRRPEDAIEAIGWVFVAVVGVFFLALFRRR